MSDSTNKFALFNVEVPESIDNAAKNLTDKPTLNMGQTLADCWYLVFGGLTQSAEKKKLRYAHELSLFKDSLEQGATLIPIEKKIEPKMQIVGPALENAKYCIESEEIRNMFSKLIINSMNIDFENIVHPSFGEILKQMSPLDAKFFKYIMNNNANPIMHVQKLRPDGGFFYLCKYLSLYDEANYDLTCNSIENLCRLNLIEIPADGFYNVDEPYQYIRETQLYQKMVLQPQNIQGFSIKEEKKLIDKTTIGLAFAKVCFGV